MLLLSGYDISERLYEGRFSLIYRGRRLVDGLSVVLKMLKEESSLPEHIAWFRHEYDVTRTINFPGVISVYALEIDRNCWTMVLEDFGGKSLARLELAGTFTLPDFLTVALKIAANVEQIHQQHIIHKDLNPSNILLNPAAGQVKLIDFGLATVLAREQQSVRNPDALQGTLPYISPEQTGRMNRVIDYRTDFYSLGVTFYELLTGRLPFEAKTPLELVHAHIARDPAPPHTLKSGVPPALSAIILKLMAKNAEDRYQSVYGLKVDLEHCLKNLTDLWDLSSFIPGRHDISDRFQIPQRLYGREQEIDVLIQAFDRVSQGAREILLITGASGVGKSALVDEVQKHTTLKGGYFIFSKFSQFQRNIPYSALSHAFNQFCNMLLTEPPDLLTDWKTNILDAVGGNGQVLIDVIPRLELIIGKQPAVTEVGFQEAQNRFSLFFQRFIRAVSGADHPLVLFIDDLHWADSSSFHLLRLLLTDPQSQHLLVIGAYRDRAVPTVHPLMNFLDEIEQAGVTRRRIQIENLRPEDVSALLADTLGGKKRKLPGLQDLSALAYDKTLGNAFFIIQFLHSLYDDGWLTFDPAQRRWRWDIKQIRAANVTDNVVDLLVKKIRRLPLKTQDVLRLAACIGATFDLHTLAAIHEHIAKDTLKELLKGIEEGLIIPLDEGFRAVAAGVEPDAAEPVRFKFVHDRVEQAASSLIDTTQREAVHLRIGRLLLTSIPPEDIAEQLFDLAHHLNRGSKLVMDPDERLRIAEINLLAARKAKTATAYMQALKYAESGIGLLPDESWQSCYDVTLHLHGEAIEAAYLSGNRTQMERVFEIVLRHARTPLDTVKAYEVKIEALKAEANLEEAINTGLRVLKQLGVVFPGRPSKIHVILALLRLKLLLVGKRPEDYINLPDMTDPTKLAALKILLSIGSAAHFAGPDLLPLLVFKDVFLSVRYGNTPGASFNYATYAFSLCGILGNLDAGYQFGQLALQVLQRFRSNTFRAKTLFMLYYFVIHWKEHVANTLQPLLEAYHSGLETGDFEYAGYGLGAYIRHAFFLGNDLAELGHTISVHHPMMRQLKQEIIFYNIALCHQTIVNLRGGVETPCMLDGEQYHEADMPRHVKQNHTVMMSSSLYHLILCFLFHAISQACEYADAAESYLDGARSTLTLPLFHFYASLSRLAAIPDVSPVERKRLLEQVQVSRKRLKTWARHAPMNYRHKWALVEAERDRVAGKAVNAAHFYDQAIEGAREYGYVNDVALACELAGQFYLTQGRSRIARFYLTDAHEAYQRWGASAKAKDLKQRYPQCFADTPQHLNTAMITISDGTTIGQSQSLDVTALMKASQMLSEEIQLDRLLQRLMKVVIENAGAERGILMLPYGESWQIRAEGHVQQDHIVTIVTISHDLREFASEGIVNYVIRTWEPVVLHDAMREGMFTHEPHIMSRQVRSVLCVPLRNQGKLTGVVYLENNVSAGAFTTDRIAVLNLLSSQAAISLENAMLYETLEHKVVERTQQLTEAKKRAEAANHAKSTFLSNMSHELRTPLNGILGYAQILIRRPGLDSTFKNGLDVIYQSGSHLLTLITDILDLSKIEARKMELYLTELNLPKFLDGVAGIISMKAQQKDVRFVQAFAFDLPTHIEADEKRLRQVLLNLLGNAVKFTESGGKVTFKVTTGAKIEKGHPPTLLEGGNSGSDETRNSGPRGGGSLHFEISDTGVGMTQEQMTKIFQPFEQVGDAQQRAQGTGLGLSISQQLVELMGGTIHVRSEAGHGSTFWFEAAFPALELPTHPESAENREIVGYMAERRQKVLVADDKEENRLVLHNLLEPVGFEVMVAINGREALEQVRQNPPDLILMDLIMPVMDGFEAVRQVRQMEGLENMPIIAVSASVFEMDQMQSQRVGCHEFLPKPLNARKLFDCLERHLPITWEYETAGVEETAPETPSAELIAPSSDVLASLYESATLGMMREIRKHSLALESQDERYAPFAQKLRELADNFDDEQLIAFLKDYI